MTDEHIQKLMRDIRKAKVRQQKEDDKITYKKKLRTRDTIKQEHQEKLENMDIKVELPKVKDKEQVYQEMKNRFRMAWKSRIYVYFDQIGPGFLNDEFSKIPTLKGKILDEWEIERINLAERSYKAPVGFKGFKIPSQYLEFKKAITPPRFRQHLEEFQVKFDDFVQRPSKYGKVHEDDLIEKVKVNNKEPFRLVNSVQYNEFGFDRHLTWEAELSRKGITRNKLQSTK